MKRMSVVLVCAAVAASAAFAQEGAPPAGRQGGGDEGKAAEARSAMLARTGGLLEREGGEGPVLLFLNLQSRVPERELAEVPAQVSRVLRAVVALKGGKAPKDPVAEMQARLRDAGVAAAVGVCDAASLPATLVAPEARWALVNVAALAADKPPAEVLAARVRKEQWRAFAHLMGAAESTFEQCLMKPVHSLADLDALAVQSVCPEPFGKIMANVRRLNVRPIRTVTYRKACEEGWAPAPTNDVQRAVWDEVKAKAK